MVSDTRSARKSKEKTDDHSSKKAVNLAKDSTVGSPSVSGTRSARETSSSMLTTPSPQSIRKSKRLEKGIPPLTPPVKRNSERLDKHNTPSPVRGPDRGKKNLSSSSSGSKQSAKELSLSGSKRRKEKTLIQLTMECKEAEHDLGKKRKKRRKLTALDYGGQFKRQRIKEIAPDGDVELEGRDQSSDVCRGNSRGTGPEPMGNGEDVHECNKRAVGKLRDESIDKTDGEVLQKSICSLKGCDGDIQNDVNVVSSVRDNVVGEPCSTYSHTSLCVAETFDCTERSPTNCFSTENIDALESESSTCLERSQDGSVSSENCEKFMHTKVAGTTSSPSSKCENCNLLGTCFLCSKNKRIGYDSPEQELCSCDPAVDEDMDRIFTCKDRRDKGAAVTSESGHLLKERDADPQMDGHGNMCALCEGYGELLCCEGKGCKRYYHPGCLDPPLTDALPGVWHCPQCVKKKLLFGVHSVSEGVESIWDVREVEVSNAKGVRQRQYLVKYHGLAHIHNHWVPEKQLSLENPSLVLNFIEKYQIVRWSAEWTVPHRLLRKRPIQDKIYIASSSVISVCNYEWLVKWCGLSYDHATWELENADFLSSPLCRKLMKDYEIRCQKAKQEVNKHHEGFIDKLSELPDSPSLLNDNYVLENVNKLRDCLLKCQNAVVLDDQEHVMTVIFLIQSMTEFYRPFLIVTASSSLSQWEAEFARLVPSVDIVVYSGNKGTRKGIRASEIHEEGGRVMLQVLLSSAKAVFEDLDELRSIKWKAIVIDGYQHSGISNDLEQIRMLTTDMRILLVSGQIKDTTSEYLKILSLLEPDGDFDKAGLKSETNVSLCKLKDRLSRFIAYGSTSQVSKFLEYWVPVQMSNYQLELYCNTLLSNSITLRSCSKSDKVGAFRDILLTVRKCCDHPYLLDYSAKERLIAEGRPAADILDFEIKASGKLQLLDMILTEIKMRGLQVLVLFQLIVGPGKLSTGHILDDFLCHRFGHNTYERVDAGLLPSKKHAASNRFNKKETGQFVFLLENRACSSTIRLSSVDVIIIYDSDWNPANDLKALQRISFDSKVEQIKVFRLYSSFTIEESALVLAKQNLNLDNNLQHSTRTTSDTLLSWGAMYLFSKLDEYHVDNNSNLDLNFLSGQSLLNEVTKEFQAIISGNCEITDSNAVISKVNLGVGSYSTDVPMLGEAKVELKDEEEPFVFWRNLLDGKNPRWKHLKGPCPRNRKRVHYLEESPRKTETEKHDVVKKCKKMLNENLTPSGVQVELGVHQGTQATVPNGVSSTTIKACNPSQDLQGDSFIPNKNPTCISGQCSFGDEVSVGVSEEIIVSSAEQKSQHSFLQGEMTRLCQTLKLSEDITHAVRRFLDYVVKNRHVNSDSPSFLQAFQISLCWIAASITKRKVDKKDSLLLAKQLLNYQCTEEQVNSVYKKMRDLKRDYLQCSENNIDSGRDGLVAEEDIRKEPNVNEGSSQTNMEIGEKSANEEHAEEQKLLPQKLVLKDKAASSEMDDEIERAQKKCDKRMKRLRRKHQEELQEFHRVWEEKRVKLETDHKLESAFIRSILGQGSVRVDKLTFLDDSFANKMKEHNLLKHRLLKDLETEQLNAMNEERRNAAQRLAKAITWAVIGAVNGPQSRGSQSGDDVAGSQPSTHINVIDPEAIDCEAPREKLITAHAQDGVAVGLMSLENSSLAINEHLNPSKNSSDNVDTVSADLPARVEQVSAEIQSVVLSEEVPVEVPETVPNEVVENVQLVELSNASKKESGKGSESPSPDASMSQDDGTDGAASVDLPNQVRQQNIDQSLVSTEPQDLGAPGVESLITSQIQVATTALVDVTPMPSIPEATATDEVVNHVLSNPETPVTDEVVTPVQSNLEAPVNVSLSCNRSPAIEDHDERRNSSQTAEPRGTEISHESISQSGEKLEMLCNHLDIGPASGVAHGQSIESSVVCQNDVAIPEVMVGTAEQPNQAVPQLGIDGGNLHGPDFLLVPPTHQPNSWNSTPLLLADPLQNEIERLRKETEQLEKNHEDLMSQLKSDCEKEIQEIIIQIRKKYEVKLLETEAEFRLKRNEMDKNQKTVLMNKMLAEAFRTKCLDPRPSRLPGMRQGVPSSFTQQLHQLPMSPSSGPSPGASASHSAPTPQRTTTPSAQPMPQQLSRPHSVRTSLVDPSQSVPAPSVQTVQNAATLVSGVPSSFTHHLPISPSSGPSHAASHSHPAPTPQQITTPSAQTMSQQQQLSRSHPMRTSLVGPTQSVTTPSIQTVQNTAAIVSGRPPPPLIISSITPSGNPRAGGEIRSRAPHLQAFRPPSLAASIPTATSPSISQLRPRPLQMPPPRPPPSTNLASQTRPVVLKGAVPENRDASSTLPEICSTFGSLELSDFEMMGNVQGSNQTSSVAKDVVCLSDDE